jgi:general stress protein YciG
VVRSQRFIATASFCRAGIRLVALPQGPEAQALSAQTHHGITSNEEDAVDGVRKERRGFASMPAEKQREIASKGGRAAHEKGTAHEWTPDEARNAGRKGGQISRGGRGRLIIPTAGDVNTVAVGTAASGADARRSD